MPFDDRVEALLRRAAGAPGGVLVLTGAGISAASGIPTFRGPEGFWTVGSVHYAPQEIATWDMFQRQPELVWSWYLYRLGIIRKARPNAAHRALVELEGHLADRFLLLTQNVDGLHLEAGSSLERTFQVHGNLHFMRCSKECPDSLRSLPNMGPAHDKAAALNETARRQLVCPRCAAWMRPHVLWFDETYDEPRYRFQSALAAAAKATLLIVIGTSAATTLPVQVGKIVAQRGAVLIDIDPEPNPFATLALRSPVGCFLQGDAVDLVPQLVERLAAAFATPGR